MAGFLEPFFIICVVKLQINKKIQNFTQQRKTLKNILLTNKSVQKSYEEIYPSTCCIVYNGSNSFG